MQMDRLELEGVDPKVAENMKKLAKAISKSSILIANMYEVELEELKELINRNMFISTISSVINAAIAGINMSEYRELFELIVNEMETASKSYKRQLTDEEAEKFFLQLTEKVRKRYMEMRRGRE